MLLTADIASRHHASQSQHHVYYAAKILQRLFGIRLRTSIDDANSSQYERSKKQRNRLRSTQSFSGPFRVDIDHTDVAVQSSESACCCRVSKLSQGEQTTDMRGWQASGGVAVLTAPGANLSTLNQNVSVSDKRRKMKIVPDKFELEFGFYSDDLLRSATPDTKLRDTLSMSIPPEFRYILPDKACVRCTQSLETSLTVPRSKLDIGISASELYYPCHCYDAPHYDVRNLLTGAAQGIQCIHGNEPPVRSNLKAQGLVPVRRKRNFNLAKSFKKFAMKHNYQKWSVKVSSFYKKKNRETRQEKQQETRQERQRETRQERRQATKLKSNCSVSAADKQGDSVKRKTVKYSRSIRPYGSRQQRKGYLCCCCIVLNSIRCSTLYNVMLFNQSYATPKWSEYKTELQALLYYVLRL